ncbi:ceramidase [Photobacterium sp. OFAV2-7]|uniref:ceramidase n=1 Tax=Photobacterium sp. OFAV2-7 TaxID=2917748 RepID=UPI001EF60E2B|nr:ceramidase [Photobacterium sp. OFAV2-7]MCG7587479.1 ceramidase [Photobacterium sp. OFAV2-7]
MTGISYANRLRLLLIIAIILAILTFYFSPITQSRNFYDYADQRAFLGLPNFLNVISNLPFLLVGTLGLKQFHTHHLNEIEPRIRFLYPSFFIGLVAAFFGSSYYHLAPNAFTLMVDRIPITIAFISLYCIVLSEYIKPVFGRRLFIPAAVYGVLSVVYWYATDVISGRGDLSAYVLVQVIPIIHLPLIIGLFKSPFSHGRYYLYALLAYVLSKWAESNDEQLYALLGGFSGHSVKHLLAALGGYMIYLGWIKRVKDTESGS